MQGLTGNKLEKACDLCHITLNKNAVVGDVSAMTPGGARVGTPAMTSRGLKEADFEQIGEFLHRVVQICLEVQESHGKLLKDWTRYRLPFPSFLTVAFASLDLRLSSSVFLVACHTFNLLLL